MASEGQTFAFSVGQLVVAMVGDRRVGRVTSRSTIGSNGHHRRHTYAVRWDDCPGRISIGHEEHRLASLTSGGE